MAVATRAREDCEASFEALFRAHHLQVLAYALRRTDPSTAHDVTAETFAIAWRRLADLPPRQPLPWLYGIARRVLANLRRTERRQQELARLLAVDPREIEPWRGIDVRAAFAELSCRDQEALMLVAWEGLSAREAAFALDVSYGSFRVRLHRAKRRLRRTLELADRPFLDAPTENIPASER